MKMICTKCGAKVGVRKDVFEKRVKRFGSEEDLLKTYTCRKCRGFTTNHLMEKQMEMLKNTNPELYQKVLNEKLQGKYQNIKKTKVDSKTTKKQ
jgi:hypothetical protein